ncbi:MAG TPA: hypothetical protein VIV35_05990 [Chitinophagaceae bacterium]
MKSSLFALFALVIIAFACTKDKFTTEPVVTVKSISPSVVFSGDIITMKGKYTDLEGDIDSILVVYKWYNGATVVLKDTFRYSFAPLDVPPKTQEADINVTFTYVNTTNPPYLPGVPKDTTATLGLILKDKASHRSNYSESNQIRLKKP